MELTTNEVSVIHRMLGQIEGVAFTLEDESAGIVFGAIEVIDGILGKKKGGE